jgi:LysM repeat protein
MTENTSPTQENKPEKKPVKLKPLAPPPSKPPAELISSYRKSQQAGPFIIWGLVILLVFVGILMLVFWMMSSNGPKISLFATATPTYTITPSPTNTATQTPTATVTVTPSITPSATPDKPFEYVVQEGDTLSGISEKNNLGDFGVQMLFYLNPTIDPTNPNINIGDKILIPNPGYQLPTATPIPSNLPPGSKLDYFVQPGDTMAAIASRFNSTIAAILKENKIAEADQNKIFVGQKLVIPVNLVTPTSAPKPTITPGASPTPPSPFTATPPGGVAPTVEATATK